jgi:hypothetical protein
LRRTLASLILVGISGWGAWMGWQGAATLPPPLATCSDDEIAAALAALPAYQPTDDMAFVGLGEGSFVVEDAPFAPRGINYYPSRYPWRRFLLETDAPTLEYELDLLQSAGLNTLRVFLWHEALFQCSGSGAVPVAAVFRRFDEFIRLAAARGFRLIVTLNDLTDLVDYPLYNSPAHSVAQTAFIVERYRQEPAILAWDLRNEGDIDYGSNNANTPRFPRQTVLDWLARTSAQVRALQPQQLITAGWYLDAEATAPHVDFISFHHWFDAASMIERIMQMRAVTDKPILLQEFGYSVQRMSEADQARTIAEIIAISEQQGLMGWLIWTAFDFPIDRSCYPSPCLSPDNAEHYFGLWRTDYTPKPAVTVISGW